jgi:crossover junction endodeoxyribonuclease RusA
MRIEFFVPGTPQPGGSKRAFVVNGRAVVTEDAKRNRPWRNEVASRATDAHRGDPLEGPLALSVTFSMPRPKGHYGTGRNAAALKPNAPRWHTSRPDRTKLLRALEDALTGILWRDDAQVVAGEVRKLYGRKPGAYVLVEMLPAEGVAS